MRKHIKQRVGDIVELPFAQRLKKEWKAPVSKYWLRESWSVALNDWIYKAYPTTPEEQNFYLGKAWKTHLKQIAIELPKSTQKYARAAHLALLI